MEIKINNKQISKEMENLNSFNEKTMVTNKQTQIIEYSIIFDKVFKKVLSNQEDAWQKNTDLYIFLLKRIEKLGGKKILKRIQKSRMCKALELVYMFHFWKLNPNVNLNASTKEASKYFTNESFYDELNKLGFKFF